MKRIPAKGGDEVDALSRKARKIVKYLTRAGVTKRAKTTYNRRFRRKAKADTETRAVE